MKYEFVGAAKRAQSFRKRKRIFAIKLKYFLLFFGIKWLNYHSQFIWHKEQMGCVSIPTIVIAHRVIRIIVIIALPSMHTIFHICNVCLVTWMAYITQTISIFLFSYSFGVYVMCNTISRLSLKHMMEMVYFTGNLSFECTFFERKFVFAF